MPNAMSAMSAPNEQDDVSDKLLQALEQGAAAGAGGHAHALTATQDDAEDEEDFQPFLEVPTDPNLIHGAAPVTPMARTGALLRQRELPHRRANMIIQIKIPRPHQSNREGGFYEPLPVEVMNIHWRLRLPKYIRQLQRC